MSRSPISKLMTNFQLESRNNTALHVVFWVFWFLPLYMAYQLADHWQHGLIDALLIPYSLASSILVWRFAARSTGNRWVPIAYRSTAGLWLLILITVVGFNVYFSHF